MLSTNFGARIGDEAGQVQAPHDYDAFVAATDAIFARLRAERMATAEDVARVIYDAVTDGTDQLRYVATDDVLPIAKARRETSEREYIAFMRSRYMTGLSVG